MTHHLTSRSRRHSLQLLAGAAAATLLPARAQGPRAATTAPRQPAVLQMVDMSPTQQDVSRDFLVGARAAWQDFNARGGLRGRTVQHLTQELDGSAESVRQALQAARDNPQCVALAGTTGDAVSTRVARQLHAENSGLAHIAPWLHSTGADMEEQTFPIFASRQEQIAHALKSVSVMGLTEMGAVYASAADFQQSGQDAERIAAAMQVRLRTYRGDDLLRLGQTLNHTTPAVLLFMGGTPELVQFTQGLEKQARQRYVVALADVNMQTLVQMGAGKSTPVIGTQTVPVVQAALPVVRQFREVLGRLFDEPPTPLGLAGFISARYTQEMLADVEGSLTRANVLAAAQKRSAMDIGGYRVSYTGRKRGSVFVTQSLLTVDGRLVG